MDIFDLEFVRIAEEDDGEVFELPLENNGNLDLTTLQGKFPHALGLIFKADEDWVGVKKSGKCLQPPRDGWGKDKVYLVSLKEYKDPAIASEMIKEKQDYIFQLFQKLSGFLEDEKYSHKSVIGAQEKVIQVFQEQLNFLGGEQMKVIEVDDAGPTSIFKPQNIDKPCNLFKKGYCHFGSKCTYLHALTSERKRTNEDPIDLSSLSKVAKSENGEKDETRNLFVFVLPANVTEEQIKKYFTSACGKLESCKLRMNQKSGTSRRVADIRFETKEAERAALTGKHTINGKFVNVDVKALRTLRLKVEGITPLTSGQDLKRYFSKFGDIHQAFISKIHQKVGYVHLNILRETDLNALNQNIHLINGNEVSIRMISKNAFKDSTLEVEKGEMKSNTTIQEKGEIKSNNNIQEKGEIKSNTNIIQETGEVKSNTNIIQQHNKYPEVKSNTNIIQQHKYSEVKSSTNIIQQHNKYPVKGSRDGGRIERLNQEIDRLNQEISVRDHKYKVSKERESSQGTSQYYQKDKRDLRDAEDFKSRGQQSGRNPDDSISYKSRMDYQETAYMDNGRHSSYPSHDEKWSSYTDKDSLETFVPEQSSAVTQLKSVIYSILKNPN